MPDQDTLLADRYRLTHRIGAGATGEVWRARDVRLARDVAVKLVNLRAQNDAPGMVARFRREASASAAISSPNIVSVFDAGRDGDTAFIVMELLSGPSLKDMVEQGGPLDFESGLDIAAQTASGLADAHAAGFVHRDLKPANVVLNDGVPKIVDFGIARLADPGDATQTSATTVAGTAAYMAPEQAAGKSVTPASDVYSLGCLLFTMFAGDSPFAGRGAIEQAMAHVHEGPPTLADRRPDTPAPLDALVTSLLNKDPGERPEAIAVARVLEAIRDHLVHKTTPAGPPPAPAPVAAAALAALGSPRTPTDAPTAGLGASGDAEPGGVAVGGRPVIERRRRGPNVLPWLVTLMVACAAAVVGYLIWGQTQQARPAQTTTPSTVQSATPVVVPTLALPSVTAQSPHPAESSTSAKPTKAATTATTAKPSTTQPAEQPTSAQPTASATSAATAQTVSTASATPSAAATAAA